MPLFTPPTAPYIARGDIDAANGTDRVLGFMAPLEAGETVWKDAAGLWHQQQFPFQGSEHHTFHRGELTASTTAPGLGDAQRVYLGGHRHQVTDAEADELVAQGYKEQINAVSPVTLTWDSSELGLLFNQVMTPDPPSDPAPPAIDATLGSFRLQTGQANLSNRRDFWLHDHTSGWVDVRATLDTIDPLFFGTHSDLGNILPQGGVVLRFQHDTGADKVKGVAVNNNIAFLTPLLNIGVWQADSDGSNFQHRETSIDLADMPTLLPYGVVAELVDNVLTATVVGNDGESYTETVDLDVDAGDSTAIPTPTGDGTQGGIAAHTGTHPLSAVRLGRTTFERLDSP